MAKRFFSMTGLAVVVLIVLAACGAPKDDGPEPTVTRIASPINAPIITATSAAGEPTVAPTAAGSPEAGGDETAGGEQEITITAHDIYFDPAEITAKAGKVKFILPNEGAAPHDFSIDDLNIQVDMPPGETQTLEVDLPAGTYQYYCNVPGHKDAGMVGTLVVE